jgi:hypothetical protein
MIFVKSVFLPFLDIDDTHAAWLSGRPVACPYVVGIFGKESLGYIISMLVAVNGANFNIERFGVALLFFLHRLGFQLRIEHFEPLAPTQ